MGGGLFNVYLKDNSFEEPEDSVYYLVASNGVFQIKKTKFFVASLLVMQPVTGKSLPWLTGHFASIRVNLPKKVPGEILKSALGFFRAVYNQFNKSEAIVILYWSSVKNEYLIKAPNQKVMAMNLPHYEVGGNPEGLMRIGTIHSHCDAAAFHSEVDQADEAKDDGIHITIGNINAIPSYSCSVVCDGQRLSVGLEKVTVCEQGGEFPAEWIRKVKLAPRPKHIQRSKTRIYRSDAAGYQRYLRENFPDPGKGGKK